MGSKNKLKRFKENETFKNVIQPSREEVVTNFIHKGGWHSFFGNNNPIVVELGCGKGEYTIALAQKNPQKNFIGIDIKGARFWRGAKTAIEENLENVAFVRTQIELVDFIFAKNDLDVSNQLKVTILSSIVLINKGNLEGLKILWEDYEDTDFGKKIAWDYIFQKVYVHSVLKKQKETMAKGIILAIILLTIVTLFI